MLLFAMLETAFAIARSYLLSLVLIASVGFAETAFAELTLITLQVIAPDHLRGRIMRVCIISFDGSLPLGYLLLGSQDAMVPGWHYSSVLCLPCWW